MASLAANGSTVFARQQQRVVFNYSGLAGGMRAPFGNVGGPSGASSGHAITLADGSWLLSTNVELGHRGSCGPEPRALPAPGGLCHSLTIMRSWDRGLSYHFISVAINASDHPEAYEGAGENDMALLGDGRVLLVARMCGESRSMVAGNFPGVDGTGYLPYYKAYSSDKGQTWTKAVPMAGIGCVRPRLLQMGSPSVAGTDAGRRGPLLLESGRQGIDNISDVTLWVNEKGDGVEWSRYSISYQHNRLVTNQTRKFTHYINGTYPEIVENHGCECTAIVAAPLSPLTAHRSCGQTIRCTRWVRRRLFSSTRSTCAWQKACRSPAALRTPATAAPSDSPCRSTLTSKAGCSRRTMT